MEKGIDLGAAVIVREEVVPGESDCSE